MFLHLFVILFMGGLCPGRGLCPGGRGSLSRGKGVSVWGVLCPGGRGSLSGGRGSLSGGVSVQGQGGLCQGDPLYGKERAVRILLECFLVFYCACPGLCPGSGPVMCVSHYQCELLLWVNCWNYKCVGCTLFTLNDRFLTNSMRPSYRQMANSKEKFHVRNRKCECDSKQKRIQKTNF